ncbi:hypothetical protein CRG98_027992 [Punica granatum]|uniref:Filament-like plant protein 7 n=1 Tax=Punica granatum TaxID=22663 RepID=A0A2I0J7F0_PUNGR|nr:hypothetical protein CRG98_027992 [Punica granatum]
MDNKAWLWRKKSAEKTTVSSSGVNSPLEGFEEQVGAFQNGGAELEKGFKDLNGKLSSALSNSDDKDDLAKKHEKMAQDTLAARDMAESELMSLRKKSDECLKQRAADEERLTHLDLALRESTQHLQFLREEQEHRIHDAVIKVSKEFEKSRFVLEERLEETTKRLAKIVLENNHLSKSLLSKERLIEDLSKQRSQVESELSALMNKLDSMERENASLKYEVRVLEKELDIRNEEREFNRRSAEISQKQHSERAKKVAKLESECQRLRLLVRKRLPGPVALTKMRNEAEALTRDPSVMRIGALTDQLNAMEEENRALREALERKSNELQVSRNMYFQAASKSSQRNINKLHHEPSIASVSDIGSDDKASRAESWTSALISELENFRNEKLKELPISATTGASEIDLMDDFVEMEKIAVSSANQPFKERLSNFSERGVSKNKEPKEDDMMNKELSQTVESLRSEMGSRKESKRLIEDQIKSHRSIDEDLDRQISAARAELNEARERSSSLEGELENKNSCCEELENTCLDLQLQLESVTQSEDPKDERSRVDKTLRTDLEITAATEKLAECQETILNLRKQLKAVASPDEANLFDKVIVTTTDDSASPKKSTSHRPSLLDQMLAEDKAKANDNETRVTHDNPMFIPDEPTGQPEKLNGFKGVANREGEDRKMESLAIVPLKKQGGGGIWRKLFWRKKRVSSKKASAPHVL